MGVVLAADVEGSRATASVLDSETGESCKIISLHDLLRSVIHCGVGKSNQKGLQSRAFFKTIFTMNTTSSPSQNVNKGDGSHFRSTMCDRPG